MSNVYRTHVINFICVRQQKMKKYHKILIRCLLAYSANQKSSFHLFFKIL